MTIENLLMSGCGFSHENGCKSSWAKFQYTPSQLNNTQKMIQLIDKQTAMTATTDVAPFPGHSHCQFLIACSTLPPLLAHTASDQKLAVGMAWERGYY